MKKNCSLTLFFFLICTIILIVLRMLPLLYKLGLPVYRCPYKALTGSGCLFCGTLTSLTLMMHGSFREAINSSPIGVFLFFFILVVFAIMGTKLLIDK